MEANGNCSRHAARSKFMPVVDADTPENYLPDTEAPSDSNRSFGCRAQLGPRPQRLKSLPRRVPRLVSLQVYYPLKMASQISKKRKFVADGVFRAELNDFFTRELSEEGYSGCDVRVTHARTEIIIRATHTQEVLGEKGRRIRELTALVQKRFKFPDNSLELYAEKVQYRGLSAIAQCESLRYKLLGGLAVRRACYGVLRFVMESGAKGCEVVVSGKLRAARAKSMKFTDGFMIHSGQPAIEFVDYAVRHVMLRQGVLGIKVKIMKGWDPEGQLGPRKPLPDSVQILEPPLDKIVAEPTSEQREPAVVAAPVPAAEEPAAYPAQEGFQQQSFEQPAAF